MSDDLREAHRVILAARVDLEMSKQAISQAELARRMNTSRAVVCRLLKGHDSKVSTYLLAFDALGLRVELVADTEHL